MRARIPSEATIVHALGVLLFAFIPLVLFLYVQHPLGILASYALGIAIMFTHRFAAVPFMERFRGVRCLWCGRRATPGEPLEVETRSSAVRFVVCDARCAGRTRRFAGFVNAHRLAIGLAIFVPLTAYLAMGIVRAITDVGVPEPLERSLLQAPIALAVVTVALAHRAGPEPAGRPRLPFPVHNLFLLGVRATLVVFTVVGFFWLAQVAWRVVAAAAPRL
jgi:hypothetical protein